MQKLYCLLETGNDVKSYLKYYICSLALKTIQHTHYVTFCGHIQIQKKISCDLAIVKLKLKCSSITDTTNVTTSGSTYRFQTWGRPLKEFEPILAIILSTSVSEECAHSSCHVNILIVLIMLIILIRIIHIQSLSNF